MKIILSETYCGYDIIPFIKIRIVFRKNNRTLIEHIEKYNNELKWYERLAFLWVASGDLA